MDYDRETEHLGLDCSDLVYLIRGSPPRGPRLLGYVDRDPGWDHSLGPEPTWFVTELAELLDAWEDAGRFLKDCRAQVEADYLRAKGAR
jgi:hypothetical protein